MSAGEDLLMEALRLVPTDESVTEANRLLDGAEPEAVVRWAADRFADRLIVSTSFGAHSAVMLHLVSQVAPKTPVVFVDTGYLFTETYRFAEELTRRFDLDLRVYSPRMTSARREALYGKTWEDPDQVEQYLRVHKVEPMQRALAELGAEAWIAGLRAGQTAHRAGLRRVDVQDGRFKIHPILGFEIADVEAYMAAYDLPYHPLVEEGYRSIGDWHSTFPTAPDEDPRAGRVLGHKRECGLHLPLTEAENQSLKSSGL